MRGPRAPDYRFLSGRAQTRIYLYVLATAGAAFNGGMPLQPEQCRMRYWLANFPDQPWVEVGYSQAQYEEDRRWLLNLVEEICRREGENQFPPSAQQCCAYCTYQTLCQRRDGISGDEWFDADSIAELDL